MKRFPLLILSLLFCLSIASQTEADMQNYKKLQWATMYIKTLYVDTVNTTKLVEDAIKGMLEELDPHSSYTNVEETKKLNEPLKGNFEGIGVQFRMVEDTLLVTQTVAKGPSEKVGILAGDRIVSCNNEVIAGVKMNQDSIMSKLRGKKGSHALLKVVRRDVKDTLTFDVVRDKIPLHTIDAAYMIAPGIGYILLERFGATSGEELKEKIAALKKEGMKDLILDLKSNGGGYLGASVEIAGEFLNPGDLVVYTESRTQPRQDLKADGGGLMREGRIVVLVDQYSASAAEIVSGALQDHDRATIIGRRTFGKGLVQRPIILPDQSMIRLTVSHYYTPSGRCIQKPYKKGEAQEYSKDILNRLNHGELTCLDSIKLDSAKVFYTLKERRTVYGGGGIMPDIFVPLDTMAYTKMYSAISRQNLIIDGVAKFMEKERKNLKKDYPTFESFNTRFEVPQSFVEDVLKRANDKNIKPTDDQELSDTREQLAFMLRAMIAYELWDRNEFIRLINERDDIVKRALQFLNE
jgi:carboxyl-terminal processing protease